MELELKGIDFNATHYQVAKAFETILHGRDFYDLNDPHTNGRPPNFRVKLNPSIAGGVGNNGTGSLTLPTSRLGDRFLTWLKEVPQNEHEIRVLGKKISAFRRKRGIPKEIKETLEKTLYVDPELEHQREEKLRKLDHRLRVEKVQFGTWFRTSESPTASRSFSVEYERDYTQRSAGYLGLEYDHKLIRVELGEQMTEEECFHIVIKFSSLRKIGMGFDFGKAFIVFDMMTPPILEENNFNNRPRDGVRRKSRKERDRVTAIDAAHARIAPYAHHVRIVLLEKDDFLRFDRLCRDAQCEPRPMRLPERMVEAEKCGFFSESQLSKIEKWIVKMDWKHAFQIEALLRNGLLNTEDLLSSLRPLIDKLIKSEGERAADVLRHFHDTLKERKPGESPRKCFERVCAELSHIQNVELSSGSFSCHRITFTPTRMLLEGPYVTQSNRVIRRFQERNPRLIENFIRVDFRDEDRLSYRWDRDVDGTWFLQHRVGRILKDGFILAGRPFEFLAYSSSALREHAVWFMARFEDPVEGWMTAEKIRQSLGDFSSVIKQPSKYAARIAQAFTATDPSVKIRWDQWEEMPDLIPVNTQYEDYLYTDGVGTISPQLSNMIWEKLCEKRRDSGVNSVKPSAYQIRFLGYKGVVAVDERLEGVIMRLRPSMRKFTVPGVEEADIEIARAFPRPNATYMNRPMVSVLEGNGVRAETFLELQNLAKASVFTAGDSLENFLLLLKGNGLGYGYHLPFILDKLSKLNLDMTDRDGKVAIANVFIGRLLRYSMNDVLRDIKHKARIRVPASYQLVGIADEGEAYIQEGADRKDVYTLPEMHIFACIQESPEDEPKFLKGQCVISRSPVVHPGDVQRVYAIGEPPKDKICFFRHLKNVVVLPGAGGRPLASCLGGGDLDGDPYDIYAENPKLLPTGHENAAEYISAGTRTIEQDSTINDICDFVVEYINSDVLGLLSDKHLVIADQSSEGPRDARCLKLAQLCSQAVDYPKNGIPVDLDANPLPRSLIPFKPDWKKAEVSDARDADYYESDRALGVLFRNIELVDPHAPLALPDAPTDPYADPIFCALAPLIKRTLAAPPPLTAPPATTAAPAPAPAPPLPPAELDALFAHYTRELRYIRATHTLTDAPDVRLAEEEVVVGTILAKCTQARWRANRTFAMKLHAGALVHDVQNRVVPDIGRADDAALRAGLVRAWEALEWTYAHRRKTVRVPGPRGTQEEKSEEVEGMNSFNLLMLGLVLDCLHRLNAL